MNDYRTLVTKDRLDSIVHYIKESPKAGTIIEAGVYLGGSLRYIADHFPGRNIIGIDTFEGLPQEDWNENEIHKPGDFSDTSYEAVKKYLSEYSNIELIKGIFPHSLDMGESFILYNPISFVHVDFDFYEGIKNCLEYFWEDLIPGAWMIFDDYKWPNCPGVERALQEFSQKMKIDVIETCKYQAGIMKPLI